MNLLKRIWYWIRGKRCVHCGERLRPAPEYRVFVKAQNTGHSSLAILQWHYWTYARRMWRPPAICWPCWLASLSDPDHPHHPRCDRRDVASHPTDR